MVSSTWVKKCERTHTVSVSSLGQRCVETLHLTACDGVCVAAEEINLARFSSVDMGLH